MYTPSLHTLTSIAHPAATVEGIDAANITTPLVAAISFVVGALVTAVARSIVERLAKRSRPCIALISCRLSHKISLEEAPVHIPWTLVEITRRNAALIELLPSAPLKTVRKWLQVSEVGLKAHKEIGDHLRAMSNRNRLIDPGENIDDARERLITEWSRMGPTLIVIAEAAIVKYRHELSKELLDRHPEQWRGPNSSVVISPNSRFDLSEMPPEQSAAEEAMKMNAHRMFWIRMREDELRWLIQKALHLLTDVEAEAHLATTEVEKIVRDNTHDYVRADILVTNDGERPFGVDALADLLIDKNGTEFRLRLSCFDSPTAGDPPRVVPGNGGAVFVFHSIENMRTLVATANSGTTMNSGEIDRLAGSGIAKCKVVLKLAGFGSASGRVIATDGPFGSSPKSG